jgi:MFS transporter, ACS family, tartrate transporter
LLGVAEAGIFSGMIFYLTLWFPQTNRARFTATFIIANPLSFVIGGPLSGIILGMDAIFGLAGWQWLFLFEGLPAFLLAFAVLKLLPDGPAAAPWLTVDEKKEIITRLAAEDSPGERDLWQALRDPRVFALSLVLLGIVSGSLGVQLWLPQIVRAMGFASLATGFVVALP